MSNISDYLNKIKTAIYGKDVRGAIHDAIKQVYDDASVDHDNANMEVKMARGTYNTLGDRLDSVDEIQAQTNAQLSEITLLASTFGIKADGSDETDKLNSFLSYVDSVVEVNKVIFPKGTICINNTIDFKNTLNRHIEFIGFDTVIKLKEQSYAFLNKSPMSRVYNNTVLEGFEFDGNIENNYLDFEDGRYYSYTKNTDGSHESVGSIAIGILGDKVTVRNCKFNNISWSGVDLVNGSFIEIYDNEFTNVRQDCIPIHNGNNIRVYRNKIKNNANHGVHAYSNCSSVFIYDNVVELDRNSCVNWKPNFKSDYNYVAFKIDHELYPDSKVDNVFCYNNTVNGDYSNALEIAGYPHYFEVFNNTFVGCHTGIKITTPTLSKSKIYNNTIISENDSIYFKYFGSISQPTYSFSKNGEMEIIDNDLTSLNSACIGFNLNEDIDFNSYSIVIKENNFSFETYAINFANLLSFLNIKSYNNYPLDIKNISISGNSFNNCNKILCTERNEECKNLIFNSDFALKKSGNKPYLFNNRQSVVFSTNVEIIGGTRYNVLTLNSTNPTSYNAIAYNMTDISYYKPGLYTLSLNLKSESAHKIRIRVKLIAEDGSVVIDDVLKTFNTSNDDSKHSIIFRIPEYDSIDKLNSTSFEIYIQIDDASNYTAIKNLKLYNLYMVRGVMKKDNVINQNVSVDQLLYLSSNNL